MTFSSFTIDQHTDFLANFLPNGRLMSGKFCAGNTLRKYLTGKAGEFQRLNDLFVTFINELDPTTTTDFIEEWESAVKIPDACIPLADNIDDRRENIILKLTSMSVQTEQDYVDLAKILGFTISFITDDFLPYDIPHLFTTGTVFSPLLPIELPYFFSGDTDSKFVFVIIGDFGIDPAKADIFFCLVNALAPSTYRVVLFTSI